MFTMMVMMKDNTNWQKQTWSAYNYFCSTRKMYV